MRKSSKKGNSVRVDFTGVQAGGGARILPEGPILLEVSGISQEEGQDSGQPYLAFEFDVIEEGDYHGAKVWDNISLSPAALWKFRGFLDCLGVETEDSAMDVDLDNLLGMVVVGHIAHEEYKGKTKNRIVSYTPESESEAPPEKPTAPSRKKPQAPTEDESQYKLGQKVSFKDGRKRITGKVIGIDGDTLTVDVNGEEYELESDEIIE